MSDSERAAQHYYKHEHTKEEERKHDAINHWCGYTVELLRHIEACKALAYHLHEELPLFKKKDGDIDKEHERKVHHSVHYLDEGDSSYNLIDCLSNFFAAEL